MRQIARVIWLIGKKRGVDIFGSLLLILFIWWWLVRADDITNNPKVTIIAVGAALVVVLLEQITEVITQYFRFHRLEGTYDCYGYEDENRDKNGKLRNPNLSDPLADPDITYTYGSIAEIKYLGDVSIKITVTESPANNEWTGDCIMESNEVGIMAWAYRRLGDRKKPWRRNSMKRLHVIDARSKQAKLCLSSYNDSRFGRELLIKKHHETGIRFAFKPWQLSLLAIIVCMAILVSILLHAKY
jgi:hypothetical protein